MIDLKDKKILESLGEIIQEVGFYPAGKGREPLLIYNHGLEELDDFFSDQKFEESDAVLVAISCDKAFIFLLEYNGGQQIFKIGFFRDELLDVSISSETEIQIPKFNRFKAAMPFSPFGGAVGYLIADIRSKKLKASKLLKKIGSKTVAGKIIKLKYVDKTNQKENEIILSAPSNSNIPDFFELHWKNNLSVKAKKGDGCYIASLCYQDSEAIEVKKLRFLRDKFLSRNLEGRFFIKIYYLFSPTISKIMFRFPIFNNFIRTKILDRLIINLEKRHKLNS